MKGKIFLLMILVFTVSLFSISALNLSDQIVSYWTLDDSDTNSTHALDIVGGNHLVRNGGIPSGTPGLVGQTYTWQDGADYLQSATLTKLNTLTEESFTILMWINITTSSFHALAATDTINAEDTGWNLGTRGAGQIRADYDTSLSGNIVSSGSGENLGTQRWHFIAVVYDRQGETTGNMDRYVNGSIYGTSTVITGTSGTVSNINSFFVGTDITTGVTHRGQIDEIAIWNRSLTADEINEAYNLTLSGKRYITSVNPPNITLVSPVNEAESINRTNVDINFIFNATHNSDPTFSCSLFIDSVVNQTNGSTSNATDTTFNVIFNETDTGQSDWFIKCTDSQSQAANSSVRNLTITAVGDMTGNSTIGAISNMTIWDTGDTLANDANHSILEAVSFFANYHNMRTGSQTQFNYKQVCFGNQRNTTTEQTFFTSSSWFLRIFVIYVLIAIIILIYRYLYQSKKMGGGNDFQ